MQTRESAYLAAFLSATLLGAAPIGCTGGSGAALSGNSTSAMSGEREAPAKPVTVAETGGASPRQASESAPRGQAAEQPPAASVRSPSGDVRIISFDDLNIGLQPDVAFRPFMMTDRPAEALIGQRVNVGGYMLAGDRVTGIKEFILLKNLECKFGPGGMANHLVHVILKDDVTTSYTNKVVYIQGVLRLKPFQGDDGNTWSLYDLEGDRVTTRAPQRR